MVLVTINSLQLLLNYPEQKQNLSLKAPKLSEYMYLSLIQAATLPATSI